ncbi:hypothetical protein VRY85_01935, partial [Achromobacter sp. F4_2707]|uniref:hypothetical protein n=1 Tax=Achromobacter sp. F4_2707 TaxID=3114286 RepID=UPI0039C72DDB
DRGTAAASVAARNGVANAANPKPKTLTAANAAVGQCVLGGRLPNTRRVGAAQAAGVGDGPPSSA